VASSLDREILGGASRGDRVLTVGDADIAASICVRVNSVVGSLFDPSSEASTRNSKGFPFAQDITGIKAFLLIVVRHSGYMHPVS
jgi:hypothetical protein